MENQYIVQKTRDYSKFRTLEGNRDVGENRVRKIIASIKAVGYVVNPIIVNEKMEIIDGQGRLEALTRLRLPVYYLVVNGVGIKECISMNINQDRWHKIDYIKSYAKRGYPHYQVLLGAIEEFADSISQEVVISVLTGNIAPDRSTCIERGTFEIRDGYWRDTLRYVGKYVKFKPMIQGNWSLLLKVIKWAFKAEEIDSDILYEQFRKYAGTFLPSITTTENTLAQLEKIYNYKRRSRVPIAYLYNKTLENDDKKKSGLSTRKKKWAAK